MAKYLCLQDCIVLGTYVTKDTVVDLDPAVAEKRTHCFESIDAVRQVPAPVETISQSEADARRELDRANAGNAVPVSRTTAAELTS